ncbi:MAG: 1-acyl-sn-glycerol-3-phosphate acyltransferase [Salinivirgaceae bacterium]|nr:1-acyl-sn-glycerol-3-phosphate acyltransferase [Salinivirgaceae bacterium]
MHFYRILYSLILSARYKVEIKGEEVLANDLPKLILPNHISHIDPQLMSIALYKHSEFVPLVAERFFKIPVIKWFLKNFKAIKIPDFKKGGRDSNLMQKINNQLLDALNENKSVLIFPAGQLSSGGIERIFNKQSAHSIVSIMPEKTRVIGVRITGLWGSMWSKSWNGHRPEFLSTYLMAVVYYFANLIIFCPRRKITIEYIDITEGAKQKAPEGRKIFNTFLEDFYNENGPEKPTFVRHLFFFPRIKNKVIVK